MPSARMKKISVAMARRDAESVVRDLVLLGCVEPSRPDELPGFAEAGAEVPDEVMREVTREVLKLSPFDANLGALVLFGTQHTLMLTGWLPSRSEQQLVSMLSEHTCAWEIEDPTPDEIDLAPVKLMLPGFLGKLRSGGRRLFAPLEQSSKGQRGSPAGG